MQKLANREGKIFYHCKYDFFFVFVITKYLNTAVKEVKEFCKVPCILHMDSIKGSHRGLEKLFQG